MTEAERVRALVRRRQGTEKRELLERLLGECATSGWRVVPPPEADPFSAAAADAVRAARENRRLVLADALTAADFPAAVDRAVGSRPGDHPAILMGSDVGEVGVVEADVALVRSCALAILDQDRDSLVVAGPGGGWGLVCQRFADGVRVGYQIESWQ